MKKVKFVDCLGPSPLSTLQIHHAVDGKLDRQSWPRTGHHNPPVLPVPSTQSLHSCKHTAKYLKSFTLLCFSWLQINIPKEAMHAIRLSPLLFLWEACYSISEDSSVNLLCFQLLFMSLCMWIWVSTQLEYISHVIWGQQFHWSMPCIWMNVHLCGLWCCFKEFDPLENVTAKSKNIIIDYYSVHFDDVLYKQYLIQSFMQQIWLTNLVPNLNLSFICATQKKIFWRILVTVPIDF